MEIASAFAAAIAPPPFQLGTEEARRDTLAREQIPAPNPGNASAASGKAANGQTGSTSGANSQLAAESDGITQARTALRRQNEAPTGRLEPRPYSGRHQGQRDNATVPQQNTALTAQTPAQQAQSAQSTATAQLLSGASAAAQSAISAVASVNVGQSQATGEARAKSDTGRKSGAQFLEGKDSGISESMQKRNRAIAARYNLSAATSTLGQRFSTVA